MAGMVGYGWEWLVMAGNGWEQLKKILEIPGNGWNDWKFLHISKMRLKWLKMAGGAGNGWNARNG